MTTLETTPTTLPRRAALVAALGLLAMAVIAAPVNFLIIEPLLTAGDTAAIGDAVAESGSLLWWAVAGLLTVAVLDVVVAGALWQFFRPVAERTARAAALLRVVYAAIFIAAIAALPGAMTAATGADVVAALERFGWTWDLGLAVFGAHLVLTGVLAWLVGGTGPKVIGVLVGIAGLGYLIDGVGMAFVDGYSLELALYTFVGELALMGWLFVRAFARTKAA